MPRAPIEEILRYYDGGITLDRFQCRVPWNTMTIDYRGDVSPCYLKNLGNVRDTPLKELWHGSTMRELRTGVRQGLWPACQGCCENEYRGGSSEQTRFAHGGSAAAAQADSLDGDLAARSALRMIGD